MAKRLYNSFEKTINFKCMVFVVRLDTSFQLKLGKMCKQLRGVLPAHEIGP